MSRLPHTITRLIFWPARLALQCFPVFLVFCDVWVLLFCVTLWRQCIPYCATDSRRSSRQLQALLMRGSCPSVWEPAVEVELSAESRAAGPATRLGRIVAVDQAVSSWSHARGSIPAFVRSLWRRDVQLQEMWRRCPQKTLCIHNTKDWRQSSASYNGWEKIRYGYGVEQCTVSLTSHQLWTFQTAAENIVVWI